MTKGKIAAQVAHASLDAYKRASTTQKAEWEDNGAKKVVLKANTLEELFNIYNAAKKLHLPCSLIKDAGKTEVKQGTVTAVAIGPAKEEDIDKITGKLKML